MPDVNPIDSDDAIHRIREGRHAEFDKNDKVVNDLLIKGLEAGTILAGLDADGKLHFMASTVGVEVKVTLLYQFPRPDFKDPQVKSMTEDILHDRLAEAAVGEVKELVARVVR